jgi:hypothetical protein
MTFAMASSLYFRAPGLPLEENVMTATHRRQA